MPPDMKKVGHRCRGDRPSAHESAVTITTTVADQTDTDQRYEQTELTGLTRYPVAYASVWWPTRYRRWWDVVYRCPHCGEQHHGRSPHQITTGVRHARCGRLIWLAVAREYDKPAGVAE